MAGALSLWPATEIHMSKQTLTLNTPGAVTAAANAEAEAAAETARLAKEQSDALAAEALIAEAADIDAAAAAKQQSDAEKPTWKIGDKARIVAVHGELLHLHTNELFSDRSIPVVIDAFTALQLDAGKLAIELD